MRVLFVNPVSEMSGAPMSLLSIVTHLIERGGNDIHVALAEEGWLNKELQEAGAKVYLIDHPRLFDKRYLGNKHRYIFDFIRATIRFASFCRRVKPHVVHVNTSVSPFAVAGARLAGIPVAVHYREPPNRGLLYQMMDFFHALVAHKILTCSKFIADNLRYGGRKKLVWYDGVLLPADANGPVGEKRILTVARLCVEKGSIKSFRCLSKSEKNSLKVH